MSIELKHEDGEPWELTITVGRYWLNAGAGYSEDSEEPGLVLWISTGRRYQVPEPEE